MKITQSLLSWRSFHAKIIHSALRSRAWAFLLSAAAILPLLVSTASSSYAGSAKWKASPATGDWNTAGNWSAGGPPNGSADTATFNTSTKTALSLSASTEANRIVFNAGASAFTITTPPVLALTISGVGITNNSGITQNLVSSADSAGNFGILSFTGGSSAGNLTALTSEAGLGNGLLGGFVEFHDSASAGESTITSNGSLVSGASGGETDFFGTSTADHGTFRARSGVAFSTQGGTIAFFETSTAGDGVFTAEGGAIEAGFGGYIYFRNDSTAAQGTFTAEGGAGNFATGGNILFEENATADQSVITNEGGQTIGPTGGSTVFLATSTADNATLTATGGSVADAQGGTIFFYEDSSGGTARVELFGNGQLDNSIHNLPGLTIGSLEGDGNAFLGSVDLAVGSNNLSTTFSGIIQDGGLNGGTGGSLTKIGKDTLTLSKASTYTGGTTIKRGTLLVTNRTGSATGTGAVQVNSGTLGGTGIITGAVAVGAVGHIGTLSPGKSAFKPGTLTINSALTFTLFSHYKCVLDRSRPMAGEVTALGVTINSGALFDFFDIGTGTLTVGTVFTVINNTSASPITGTFNGLANGSVFTSNGNNFQANYEGGDGNDLTLTVVP